MGNECMKKVETGGIGDENRRGNRRELENIGGYRGISGNMEEYGENWGWWMGLGSGIEGE